MKITRKLLLEIIESEISLLNEANETEALRAYFSINDQVELKQGNKGDIVTALQDFLIEKASEVELSKVESITVAVGPEGMGTPDGNFGPNTAAAVKAFQTHYKLKGAEGVYNSAVHKAIAGTTPSVEAPVEGSKESAEETADFLHPKWDSLLEELGVDNASDLKGMTSEEAKTLIEDIKKTFRSKLIDFVKGFRLSVERGKKSLHIEMKKAIRNKFVGRVSTDDPSWVLIDNIEEEFNSLVGEQQSGKIFDDNSGTTASRYGGEENEVDGTTSVLKASFKSSFIVNTGEFVPSLTIGDFMNIEGVIKLKSLYNGVNEIIEKWDIVNKKESKADKKEKKTWNADDANEPDSGTRDEAIKESISYSRFQKLAGI
jgi:peptidoglycan hydrolase-like protein with peptidoglycan-binding domain